jgi:3-dehydroquinate synthetase
MVTASCVADIICGFSTGITDRIVRLLKEIGLPYKCPVNVSRDDILAAMSLDKKVSNGKLNAVISVEIGTAYVDDSISQNQWLAALDLQSQL